MMSMLHDASIGEAPRNT